VTALCAIRMAKHSARWTAGRPAHWQSNGYVSLGSAPPGGATHSYSVSVSLQPHTVPAPHTCSVGAGSVAVLQ